MTINEKAPVSAKGTVEVDAPPSKVWQIISDIDNWPSWNPDVRSARLEGKLQPGSAFVWKAGPGRIRSVLTAVERGALLAWRGETLGISALHVWRLEPTESGTTHVVTEESWAGLLPRAFPRAMTRTLQAAINNGLQAIKQAVES